MTKPIEGESEKITTKFKRTELEYWFSGVYWYCSEKDRKSYNKTGSGKTQKEAFNDFLEANQ